MDKATLYRQERKELARFMRRLYRQGLTTASGGNLSQRLGASLVAITPSATDKGRMRGREVAIIDLAGNLITKGLSPSMETAMHLAIYSCNEETRAIVHAHPVFASAFTAMHVAINTSLTAEARAILHDPVLVPYALMGTAELARLVAGHSLHSGVLLLENHGVLTTGNSLLQAFDRLEVLENAARMTVITKLLGKQRPLAKARIQEIEKLFPC